MVNLKLMFAKQLVIASALFLIGGAAEAQTLDPAKIKSRDVAYVSYKKLRVFPTPILEYRSYDPKRHQKLEKEVVERIVYPMLCESASPIAVVIVDFCPEIHGSNERGCKDEDKGKLTIEIAIRRQGGSGFMSMVDTDLEGNFEDDAYLMLFTAGEREYVMRNKSCKVARVRGSNKGAPNKALQLTAR